MEHGQEGKKYKCVCVYVDGGEYIGLLIPSGQIIRNMLPLVKENLEDRQSPRGESCLKNETIVVER